MPTNADVIGFLRYVGHSYLVGDQVTVNLLRDGKRLDLKAPAPMLPVQPWTRTRAVLPSPRLL